MSRTNARGHRGNCGCPQCVDALASDPPSIGELVSRASDSGHGPNCGCAGCQHVERTVSWRAVLAGEVDGA